ncbi:MAG: hypothetical protein EOR54_26100 [Mesorhizobium sp.]|nr:MAG: hypothetical protein EOR54_26100 [Mesorhizobium sp.]
MGGDRLSPLISPIANVAGMSGTPKLPISPLVGEMAGRPEGGAVPPASIGRAIARQPHACAASQSRTLRALSLSSRVLDQMT